MAATLDADPEVEVGEALAAEKEDGLESLDLQSLGLDQLNRGTCDPTGVPTGEEKSTRERGHVQRSVLGASARRWMLLCSRMYAYTGTCEGVTANPQVQSHPAPGGVGRIKSEFHLHTTGLAAAPLRKPSPVCFLLFFPDNDEMAPRNHARRRRLATSIAPREQPPSRCQYRLLGAYLTACHQNLSAYASEHLHRRQTPPSDFHSHSWLKKKPTRQRTNLCFYFFSRGFIFAVRRRGVAVAKPFFTRRLGQQPTSMYTHH